MNSKVDLLTLLSENHRRILKQFRDTLQDILQPEHDDYYLLRWLKARDFDIRKSEKMIRESFKLRKKLNVDEIRSGKYILPEVYRRYNIIAPLGFDKEGCFVRYGMIGLCDFRGFAYSLSFLDVLKLLLHIIESDFQALADNNIKYGLHEERNVYIGDFRDFSIRQIYDKQVLHLGIQLIRLYQDNFPETLKAAYIINVPSYFAWIWNIFKPFVDPPTLAKLKIFGIEDQSWKDELVQIADPEIIPAFLGGTRCDPDGDTTCQNLVRWTDTKIPSSFYLKDKYILHSDDPHVKTVVVRERSDFELRIPVEIPGSTLEWEFQTKECNIRFGILYDKMECEKTSNVPPEEIIAVENVECHIIPEMGQLLCEKRGQYILYFDNKYSWLTSKNLLYKVTVTEPEEENADNLNI